MITVRMSSARHAKATWCLLAATAAAALLTAAPAALAAPTRHLRFHTIEVPGSIVTELFGINDHGAFVGIYTPKTKPLHTPGFIEANGHITSFSYPHRLSYTLPFGINNQGTVVGYHIRNNYSFGGFLRSPSGHFIPLNDPLAGTGEYQGTAPVSVNDHGVVAGYYVTPRDVYHGFVYRAGRFTTVNVPGAFYNKRFSGSGIDGVNDAGVMVGFYTPSRQSVVEGYIESPSGHFFSFVGPGAGTRPGDSTFPEAISNTGAIAGVGSGPRGVEHGWVLSRFRYTMIKDPRATTAPSKGGFSGTTAFGINRHGTVVGGYWTLPRHFVHGFLVRTGITGATTVQSGTPLAPSPRGHGTGAPLLLKLPFGKAGLSALR